MSAPNSLFVRAAKAQPTERTPVWFMRQAGRYMPEYRAIRKQYSLIEICKKPEVAAQVTIEAAEILKVDAAIIFADLLLPLEVMGLPFHFAAGEGPKIEKPVRTAEDVAHLRTDRATDLSYVSEAVTLVCKHFGDKLPVIGFCGAPFTLASYMIEGGGSRNYLFTKKMMYSAPAAWHELMKKLVAVTAEYSTEQVRAGADTIQIFDSWVGCLSVEDYRRYVLPHVTDLVKFRGPTKATSWTVGLTDVMLRKSIECLYDEYVATCPPIILFVDWAGAALRDNGSPLCKTSALRMAWRSDPCTAHLDTLLSTIESTGRPVPFWGQGNQPEFIRACSDELRSYRRGRPRRM